MSLFYSYKQYHSLFWICSWCTWQLFPSSQWLINNVYFASQLINKPNLLIFWRIQNTLWNNLWISLHLATKRGTRVRKSAIHVFFFNLCDEPNNDNAVTMIAAISVIEYTSTEEIWHQTFSLTAYIGSFWLRLTAVSVCLHDWSRLACCSVFAPLVISSDFLNKSDWWQKRMMKRRKELGMKTVHTSIILCMWGISLSILTSRSITRARHTFLRTSGSSSVARWKRFCNW